MGLESRGPVGKSLSAPSTAGRSRLPEAAPSTARADPNELGSATVRGGLGVYPSRVAELEASEISRGTAGRVGKPCTRRLSSETGPPEPSPPETRERPRSQAALLLGERAEDRTQLRSS